MNVPAVCTSTMQMLRASIIFPPLFTSLDRMISVARVLVQIIIVLSFFPPTNSQEKVYSNKKNNSFVRAAPAESYPIFQAIARVEAKRKTHTTTAPKLVSRVSQEKEETCSFRSKL
jgi:hypothetical protein